MTETHPLEGRSTPQAPLHRAAGGGLRRSWWAWPFCCGGFPASDWSNISPILPYVFGAVLGGPVPADRGGALAAHPDPAHGQGSLFLRAAARHRHPAISFPPSSASAALSGIDRDTLQQSFIALNNQLVCAKKLRVPPAEGPDPPSPLRPALRLRHQDHRRRRQVRALRPVRHQGAGGTGHRPAESPSPSPPAAPWRARSSSRGVPGSSWPWPASGTSPRASGTPIPLPVIGVLNRRPHGPCFNTNVVLAEVEKALDDHLVSRSLIFPPAVIIIVSNALDAFFAHLKRIEYHGHLRCVNRGTSVHER